MGKDKKQTTTQRLDPKSQSYVDAMRGRAQSAARRETKLLAQTGEIYPFLRVYGVTEST